MYQNDKLPTHYISIGGLYTTNKPMIIQTLLGSCVSVILYDNITKNAAMNHIVLPGSFSENDSAEMFEERNPKYGIFSIEKLLYEMKKMGSKKHDIIAKLYGASYMGRKNKILNIQELNVDFVKTFLKMVKIKIVEEHIYNNEALKVFFNTSNGEVKIIKCSL